MRERDIFIEALQRADAAERRRFLDTACAGDDVLRGYDFDQGFTEQAVRRAYEEAQGKLAEE